MKVLSAQITTWYYVILDDEISNQEFADSLEESSISLLLRLSKFVPGRWDTFTLMSIGDGRKIFKLVGWCVWRIGRKCFVLKEMKIILWEEYTEMKDFISGNIE